MLLYLCCYYFAMKIDKDIIKESLLFYSDLKQYAISLTYNQEDANDLVQDTYLKIMQYEDYFKDGTNLKAWCYTIMRNTFINQYRRNQKYKLVFDTTDDLSYWENSISNTSDSADINYSVSEINKQIQSLSEEKRKPLEMYIDGYKYKEIADEMNLSIGTVKSRIFFSRQQLMKQLEDYNG